MATTKEWISGARLRTLPAAIAPVIVGTSLVAPNPIWSNALLALLVALSLQIGVNFSNDYSDGIRGTDTDRVGPMRLVGSGVAKPEHVLAAALTFFALAGLVGLILALRTSLWLILVGALSILAAWGYTGGKRPYGYRALGEISVFLFFGVVAVLGTFYVQSGEITALSIVASIPVGAQACAILVLNNLRDRNKDSESGKRTLAVLMGEKGTRIFFAVLMLGSNTVGILTAFDRVWCALTALLLPIALYLAATVIKGAGGRDLISLLQRTALFQLLFAALYAVGFILSA
ncbi:MAG: 1,4-dihydroxy-2-naphthoate polyprenyltransferase [Candidatus Nanopelagicaceae bacterium]